MDNNTGIDPTEDDFKADTNHNNETALMVDTGNGKNTDQTTITNYGGTGPITTNQIRHSHDAGTLFIRPLILGKELKSPYDARYKTDYFPRGGKKAGEPQSPRYLHTSDGDQEVTIKFPDGYKVPKYLGNYYLEIALLTVPRASQRYWHVYKFQEHHTDISVQDINPLSVLLTKKHFKRNEVKVKLVVIKTKQDELKQHTPLALFDAGTNRNWTEDCKTIEDLEHAYELSHVQLAFSLVYIHPNGEFIRFTDTTVISNEIIEKERPKQSDTITCPRCSCKFSIEKQRQAEKKRSVSASSTSKKKTRR